MTHPLDQLAPYVDGALDPTERAVVDEHLRDCPHCRAEVEAAARARRAVRSIPDPATIDLAARFGPERVGRLRRAGRSDRSPWGRWMPALAAAAVVALVAIAVPRLGGSSDDATSAGDAGGEAASVADAGPLRLRVDPTDYDEAALEEAAATFVGSRAAALDEAADGQGDGAAGASAVEAPGALRFAGPRRTDAAVACLEEAFPGFPGRLVEVRRASFDGTPAYLGFVLEGVKDGSADRLSIWVAMVEDCSIASIVSAEI